MNYEIKPLEWKRTNNISFDSYTAQSGKGCWYAVEKESDGKYLYAYCILGLGHIILGRGLSVEKAKEACQDYHNNLIIEVIDKFVEFPTVANIIAIEKWTSEQVEQALEDFRTTLRKAINEEENRE